MVIRMKIGVCALLLGLSIWNELTCAALAISSVKNINAVLNTTVYLKCDITPAIPDDIPKLILWHRNDAQNPNPVYSYDYRTNSVMHWMKKTPRYQSNFGQSIIPSILPIGNVQLSDEGYYRCRVDFMHSPTTNQKFFLSVIKPPDEVKIFDENNMELGSGETRPYKEGSTMKLECVAFGGRPTPELHWREGEHLLESKSTFENGFAEDGSTNSVSLVVNNLSRRHFQTEYTCEASNNNSSAPARKVVHVNIHLKPVEVIIDLGNDPHLSTSRQHDIICKAIGSRPPAKITWKLNSKKIKEESYTQRVESDGNVTSILKFRPKKRDHNKMIECTASNPLYEKWILSTSQQLDIGYPPTAILQLGPQLDSANINENSDVYFQCIVDANPPPYKIRWTHNKQYLTPNNKKAILMHGNSLVLTHVNKTVSGSYMCIASNVEGDDDSNPVYLEINYAPVCKIGQKEIHGADKKQTVLITCEVDSKPDPVFFKWYFNHSREPISDELYHTDENRKYLSSLNIAPITEMDYGIVLCEATNTVGVQRIPCEFRIITPGLPDVLENCSINNATAVSLDVACSPGFDGGLIQRFEIEVKDTLGRHVMSLFAEEPVFKLNKLSPGSLFHIEIFARNSIGRSQPYILEAATLKSDKNLVESRAPGDFTESLGTLIIWVPVTIAVVCLVFIVFKCKNYFSRRGRRPSHHEEENVENIELEAVALNSLPSSRSSSAESSVSSAESSVDFQPPPGSSRNRHGYRAVSTESDDNPRSSQKVTRAGREDRPFWRNKVPHGFSSWNELYDNIEESII